MPPKKKAKKTQTVSLDKRAQAKLLRDKASAFTVVCGVGGKMPPKKKAKTAKTNNTNKKKSNESALAKVIANRYSASNEVIVETIESATFGELRMCFPLVFDGKLTSSNNKEWLKAVFKKEMSPPKRKAKKRSRAYLAELKELKRTERKYVIGNQETAEFKLYVNRKGEEVDERRSLGHTYWLVKLISSYEINADMYVFEEEEEYWNDIPKVKQELKDHPDNYNTDIVWEGTVIKVDGYRIVTQPDWSGEFVLTYHRDHDGDVEIKGKLPRDLRNMGKADGCGKFQVFEEFLCEKLKLGFESGED